MKNKKNPSALSDIIYEKCYRNIVNGKLKPGERITELQLAKSEGISQAPVREALKRLAEDRLVVLVPRSGCYVCETSRKEVLEIYDIRKVLETLALEYAFNNFDLKKISSLKDKFSKCSELTGDRFVKEEVKLDSQLHLLIYETSDGVNLQNILKKLHTKVEIFRVREAQVSNRPRLALQHHINILDAILDGDRRRAVNLLEEHIQASREYLLSTL